MKITPSKRSLKLSSWIRQSSQIAAVTLLICGFVPVECALSQSATSDHDYVNDLNMPILRVTAKNKSYEAIYQAWNSLDLSDPRAPISRDALQFGTPMLADAVAWVSEPSQRSAMDALLESDGTNPNVTFRQIFGLPYGFRDTPEEMDANGFAVYINGGLLSEADFAYLPLLQQVVLALFAEVHYQAAQDNFEGSVDALLAALRIGRQLCDRSFSTEMHAGMQTSIDAMMEVREFMWHYRDLLAVEHFIRIAEELEFLEMDQIKPPRGHEFMGEQIIERIFSLDNFRPNRDTFAQTMARFESRANPLRRFSATTKWGELMSQHATYNETVFEVDNVAGDIRLRWRFNFKDPKFNRTPEIDRISPTRWAIPRAIYRGIADLFPIRHEMVVLQRGMISAAGVAGYQVREGGKLAFDGKRAAGAPVALKQVQPVVVLSEKMLDDPQETSGRQMHYLVVTNHERHRTEVMTEYTISTQFGAVRFVEGWPILYSVGWDGDDDEAANHTALREADGDFVFWPPVEVIARDSSR